MNNPMEFKREVGSIMTNSFSNMERTNEIMKLHALDKSKLIDHILSGLDRSCRDYSRTASFLLDQKAQLNAHINPKT